MYQSVTMFGQAWLGHALVTGRSSNPVGQLGSLHDRHAVEFYDTYVATMVWDCAGKCTTGVTCGQCPVTVAFVRCVLFR